MNHSPLPGSKTSLLGVLRERGMAQLAQAHPDRQPVLLKRQSCLQGQTGSDGQLSRIFEAQIVTRQRVTRERNERSPEIARDRSEIRLTMPDQRQIDKYRPANPQKSPHRVL